MAGDDETRCVLLWKRDAGARRRRTDFGCVGAFTSDDDGDDDDEEDEVLARDASL